MSKYANIIEQLQYGSLAADGIIAEHSHGSYTVLEHTP